MTTKKRAVDDREIIELFFARNEDAIKETDKKYGRYLSVIGNNILNDRGDCDECLNDTYFTTWNKVPPERPRILQAFLSKIMRDVSISCYRKKRSAKRVPAELVGSLEELGDCIVTEADLESDFLIKEIANILNSFLADIDRRKRFIFVCRYYYCDSVKSIAAMLGLSVKTVYRELESLRGMLRERLEMGGINI